MKTYGLEKYTEKYTRLLPNLFAFTKSLYLRLSTFGRSKIYLTAAVSYEKLETPVIKFSV